MEPLGQERWLRSWSPAACARPLLMRVAIPVHAHLRAVLDATPSEHLTFLVTATGKPYGGNAFSEQFRKWCDAAGLPMRLAL